MPDLRHVNKNLTFKQIYICIWYNLVVTKSVSAQASNNFGTYDGLHYNKNTALAVLTYLLKGAKVIDNSGKRL